MEAGRPDEPGAERAGRDREERVQDTEAELEAAAAMGGEDIPERGPAAYIAEFIGTFALVLAITLAVSLFGRAPLTDQELAQGAQQPFVDFSVIGLVHVLALFMLIQTLAVVSGAHFNPAVTAALAAIRQIRMVDAGIYIAVQLLGGIAGAFVTKLLLTKDNFPNADAVHWGAVDVSKALDGSTGLGMLAEGIGTFFLVWAIVGVAVNPHAFREWAGLVIGGTLGLFVMVIAPLTGAGFNPARAFGPALASGEWADNAGQFLLVYVGAPLIGALLAAFIYMQMFILPGKKGPFGMGPVG